MRTARTAILAALLAPATALADAPLPTILQDDAQLVVRTTPSDPAVTPGPMISSSPRRTVHGR